MRRQRRAASQVELVRWPGRGMCECLTVLRPQIQDTGRTVDDLSHRTKGILARVRAFEGHRERLHETQPLEAIVILVAIEMLAQEYLQSTAQGARPHDRKQHHCGSGNEHELRDTSPSTAVESNPIPAGRH